MTYIDMNQPWIYMCSPSWSQINFLKEKKLEFSSSPEVSLSHLKITQVREFPGSPVVRTQHFHCGGPGSIPGQGTKITQVAWYSQRGKSTQIMTGLEDKSWAIIDQEFEIWGDSLG